MTNETKKLPTIEEVTANYREHHTSLFRGYVSRTKNPVVEEYSGRFGKGYVVRYPNWRSTQYSYITYYINEEA